MTLSREERQAIAQALLVAERDSAPIEPLTNTWPQLDLVDAYEIQQINITARCDEGATVRGHKVGLTAKAMQEMLGVSEPDYGHLLDDMILEDEALFQTSAFCFPRAEPELAFVLRESLQGPGIDAADVVAATEYVTPAIELIDSRIRNWEIKLPDTIADNASAARVIVGRARCKPDEVDIGDVQTTLVRNGRLEAEGSTKAVMDNPANAVAWLANKLAEFGTALQRGHLIMPGSTTRAIDLAAGDDVRVELDGIGSVAMRML